MTWVRDENAIYRWPRKALKEDKREEEVGLLYYRYKGLDEL